MLTQLKKFFWTWRGLWVTDTTETGFVQLKRWLGFLQLFELAALDQLVRLRPPVSPDSRLVVIGITETDIKQLGKTTLSDAELAQLITKIKQQQPRAIGLDIVRTQPEGTGQEQLIEVIKATPNLLGINKVIANDSDSSIQAPPILEKLGQIAGADLILDADGKLRRGFLYISSKTGETLPSLGLGVAQLYLDAKGIRPEASKKNPEHLQLGQAVFVPWETNDGGYIRTDAGGFLLLFFFCFFPFTRVSLSAVLDNLV